MLNSPNPHGALVVVATGAEAKFFVNDGSDKDVKLRHIGGLRPKDLNDDGPSGKRPPESSAQETDEATFAKQLAEHLYGKVHGGEVDHIVLVADPDTLGEIRPILHQDVSESVTMEMAKTLINTPTSDIERILSAPH